jgi:hypothetical protein
MVTRIAKKAAEIWPIWPLCFSLFLLFFSFSFDMFYFYNYLINYVRICNMEWLQV